MNKWLRRDFSRLEWLLALALTLAGSITVSAITVALVENGLATEANPITASLASSTSWSAVVALKFGVIVGMFSIYRIAGDLDHDAAGRAGAWSFVVVVASNVANDAIVFARSPVLDVGPLAEIVPITIAGVVATVASIRLLDRTRAENVTRQGAA